MNGGGEVGSSITDSKKGAISSEGVYPLNHSLLPRPPRRLAVSADLQEADCDQNSQMS